MDWTEEAIAELRRLWDDDVPTKRIAALLGEGVTKGMVIGKAHRLYLKPRKSPIWRNGQMPNEPIPVEEPAPPPPAPIINTNQDIAIFAPLILSDNPRPPVTTRVRLIDLTQRSCRYPLGDPGDDDFGFCGADAGLIDVYCEDHKRVCYAESKPRRITQPHRRR